MATKTAEKYSGKQVVRKNRELKFVRLGQIRVSTLCQRELRQSWVDELVSTLDIDKIGNPELSYRDGYYYVMDGQHRIEAVKKWLGKGWEDQHLQCWVASGLSETEEAEVFLSLNRRLNLDSFEKFKVSVRAGRADAVKVKQIIDQERLVVSKQSVPGAVSAVGTLVRVYKRNGPEALGRALRIARDSFGDAGLDAAVIDGFGLLCHRYNGILDERGSILSLGSAHGGVNGLLGMAEQLRQKTGNSKAHCVAASAVVIINRARHNGQKKLPDWWKSE